MGSFADAMLGMLFGWLQALINWIWGVIDRGGSALGTWFLQNWLPLTLFLIAGGLVVDWFIWLIRWRPYHVWGTRLRRIGRFFRRSSDEEEPGGFAYAGGYDVAEDDAPIEEDDPGYQHAYQTEIYAPTSAQAPLLADFPGDTYVDAPMPEEAYDNPDFADGEGAPAEGTEDFEAYPEGGEQWAAWPPGEELPAEATDWAEDTEPPPDWGESPFEDAQDAEDFAYRELIPLDEEEDTEAEPLWPEDGAEPDEAAEMEAEEDMYDDFSNRGAPEPPQKRRRWEFPEEDAPATTRRSRAAEEDSPPPRRDSRPAADTPAPSRRRRDMARMDDAPEPMMDVDPLAAYDAPEVMEQMEQQRPRRQGRDEGAPVEETGDGAEPRRRRRSTRRRRSEAAQYSAQDNEAYAEVSEEYPEEPLPEEAYEETEAPRRRGRSGRGGRSRGRAPEPRDGNDDFAGEEPYYEEPYDEEDLPRGGYDDGGYDDGGYDDGAYYQDDPYADDLPDSPEWNDWADDSELPRGNRGVTKPSLFDRLRGLSSPTRTPVPEEEDYYDDPYDDTYEEEIEARPKKKGLLARWLNPEQPEFQQSKPKPRVRQEDAYNEPVYPPKKRR